MKSRWTACWKGSEGNQRPSSTVYISLAVQNFSECAFIKSNNFLFSQEVSPSILGNVGTENWKRFWREHEATWGLLFARLDRSPKDFYGSNTSASAVLAVSVFTVFLTLSFGQLVYQPTWRVSKLGGRKPPLCNNKREKKRSWCSRLRYESVFGNN